MTLACNFPFLYWPSWASQENASLIKCIAHIPYLSVFCIVLQFCNMVIIFLLLCFVLFLIFFRKKKFTGYASNQRYSCQTISQPQQCGIWAASANYTTAHSSARSLTHWASPGIEPTSSWILVRFIIIEPWQELW